MAVGKGNVNIEITNKYRYPLSVDKVKNCNIIKLYILMVKSSSQSLI